MPHQWQTNPICTKERQRESGNLGREREDCAFEIYMYLKLISNAHALFFLSLYLMLSMGVQVAFAWLGPLRVLSSVLIIGAVRHN